MKCLAAFVFVFVFAFALGALANGERVEAFEEDSVNQNGAMDNEDNQQEMNADSSTALGDMLKLSKTFLPPAGTEKVTYTFAKVKEGNLELSHYLNGTIPEYVDIKDTDCLELRATEGTTKITVDGKFPRPDNAGQFPMRCEGNITKTAAGQGGTGTGNPEELLVWRAAVKDKTILFIKNDNTPYDAEKEALAVSNYVTNLDYQIDRTHQGGATFPIEEDYLFGKKCADPDNFRVEVVDRSLKESPKIWIEVVGKKKEALELNTTSGPGHRYRSPFIRLVSDVKDHKVSNARTIRVRLGDVVKISYETLDAKRKNATLSVGRAKTKKKKERDNGSNGLKHDIREFTAKAYILKRRPFKTMTMGRLEDDKWFGIHEEQYHVFRPNNETVGGRYSYKKKIMYLVNDRLRVFDEAYDLNNLNDDNWFVRTAKLTVPGAVIKDQAFNYSDGQWTPLPKETKLMPVISKDEVESDMEALRAAMAQAAITIGKVPIKEINAPEGVLGPDSWAPESPTTEKRFGKHRLPSVRISDGKAPLAKEEKAIYQLHDTKDVSSTEIRIYYVNRLHVNQQQPARGKALRSGLGHKWKNRILIAANTRTKYTLPHEHMHIFLDSSHYPKSIPSDLFHDGTKDSGALRYQTKRIPMDPRVWDPKGKKSQVRSIRRTPLLK